MKTPAPSRKAVATTLATFAVVGTSLLATGELAARVASPERLADSCVSDNGKVAPLCQSKTKLGEGGWVINSYNDCGYRSPTSCHPLSDKRERIVIMGTSISAGYGLDQTASLGAQMADRLGTACAGGIDYQNLPLYLPHHPSAEYWTGLQGKVDTAARLRPSLVLVTISSWDLHLYDPNPASAPQLAPQTLSGALTLVQERLAEQAGSMRERSRLVAGLRHFAYEDPNTFLKAYLTKADESGYMRQTYSPEWEARMTLLDELIDRLATGLRAQGVEMAVTYTPFVASPMMLAKGLKQEGVDPLALDHRLERIAERRKVRFIPLTAALASERNPQKYYFPLNGHPNEAGDAAMAEILSQALAPSLSQSSCLGSPPKARMAQLSN